jgi:glutamate/tyrosine decarboxylase-like PLP-dependent enzyme
MDATTDRLLEETAARAQRYLATLGMRSVAPSDDAVAGLGHLTGPLPEEGLAPSEVLELLDQWGSPATVASAGGRYFGFVVGSALPAALAANWLASTWNQNSAVRVMSPTAAALEETALEWIRELVGLPRGVQGAFVTGDTMANFTGLAAARHAVLERVGWDVERQGLTGAPKVTVVVGQEVHLSVVKALALVGFGRDAFLRVPADEQGRIRPSEVPALSGPTIVCLQAGCVNTGAFDPATEIIARAHAAGAWVHVDGAFGLWANASPRLRPLAAGIEGADSWALDGHKWLNVPYDSGVVFVRDPSALRSAMSGGPAAYLPQGPRAEGMELAPEMSRRARGVDAWAAIRSLGRRGVGKLVEDACAHATRFAERLHAAGYEILNDVVLNQVLVSFGDDATTRAVIAAVPAEGTCWAGGTVWHGRAALRFSVSSWATTEDDVERAAAAIVRVARAVRAG